MSATNYPVGIAGIAVAVGVGMAIASGQNVAHADNGPAKSGAESTDSSAPATRSRATKTPHLAASEHGVKPADVPHVSGPTKRTALGSTPATKRRATLPTVGDPTSHIRVDNASDTSPRTAGKPTEVIAPAAAPDIAHVRPSLRQPLGDDPAAPPPELLTVLVWARKELDTVATTLGPGFSSLPIVKTVDTALDVWIDDIRRPPAASVGTPGPADVVDTPYGDVGKWMLQSDGQISDWLGQKYGSRNLLEPVNVIIVDHTSGTPEESAQKLAAALSDAGFPARKVHSTGYSGIVDGVVYAQQPTGADEAFSDCFYLFPNDHGRVFGPAPTSDGTGYVWTAALSREQVGLYDGSFTHRYVSFVWARDSLRNSLVAHGATDLGEIALHNAVDSPTESTGDHDGYAVVIELN